MTTKYAKIIYAVLITIALAIVAYNEINLENSIEVLKQLRDDTIEQTVIIDEQINEE